jgi:sugar phosphate isomerase/epimerase
MRSVRSALATRCLGQPLKTALVVASRLGAAGVQLDARSEIKPSEMSGTGRRQFLHVLSETGLQVASLDFPLRRRLWDAERLDARLEALKETMQFAYELKARTVTVRLGGLPEEADSAAQALLGDLLNDLARHGNRVGVTLAVGPGREPAGRLSEVLAKVTEGPIGVNFDPATAVMVGASPVESLQTLRQFVAHVMIRDAVRDLEGGGVEVPVGRGDVPWEEVLALLQETGYSGWLTVDRTQGEDHSGDAGRAIQYLHSIYRG